MSERGWGNPVYIQPDGRPVYLVRAPGTVHSCWPEPPPVIEGYERVGCDLTRGKGTHYHAEYWRPVEAKPCDE